MLNFKEQIRQLEALVVLPAMPQLLVKPLNAKSVKEKKHAILMGKMAIRVLGL